MLSFPFDSRVTYNGDIPIYDRAVSSQPLRELINDLFTTGIMPNPSTCFQVSAGEEGMTVRVAAGYAVINGGLVKESQTRILQITAADTTNDRIDTVVLRWNENVDVRTADLYIVAGTPAEEPTRPELTRSGSIYEIGLADIFIPANSTTIDDERITDTRYETERCGVVSSVSEWDTTTIYQQVQADLANFQSEEQAEFIAWFNEMKDQLSEDAAGHLQLEIDELKLISSGYEGSTTVFNADGSISETKEDGNVETTVFNADGSITQTLKDSNNVTIATATTEFNADGSITVTANRA